MTTCGALLLAMLVFTVASILLRPRRHRPPQPLSDSAGSAQFAAQAREAEARGRR
jgi:hypothetical protein